ncbi:alcohol dehydrogenase catalytic domain-containing protein [Clostridium sp. AM58-1XD]|uniref:zinc-dependent alcohol dehydrogenase n=1 Tax=Clostridium sp. AM58-1XD TaxID=2292307 RepID=UPI000E535F33|nr:alcohol dehydrogenase catalytic domain-containing protein [Clostridium sp. AM58-1XD]RGY97836.1 dehydrogenase [Clostridium sp. AM58-1XD]
MKALVWTEKEKVELQDREIPDYRGRILIRTAYAGICGSDIGVYLGTHPRAKAPLVMGHEFSGTVEAVGEGVQTNFAPGDRVVVNPLYYCGKCRACLSGNTHVCRSLRLYGTDTDGGMAEYAAVPDECLVRLPDQMSLKMAAVVEPVAVVVHGLRMIKNNFYSTACVTGLGPMGLLSALMIKETGVSRLFAVEANEQRAEYGRKLGIEVINPKDTDVAAYILEQTEGEGVDVLVEASGSAAVAQSMTDYVGVRGEILLLSVFKHPAALDLRTVNFREQTIVGTRVYTKLDFKDAAAYVSSHEKTVESVVSHTFPLERGQDVFQEMISGKTNMMKVLFEM